MQRSPGFARHRFLRRESLYLGWYTGLPQPNRNKLARGGGLLGAVILTARATMCSCWLCGSELQPLVVREAFC